MCEKHELCNTIKFPGLGMEFHVDRFAIGPWENGRGVYWYGVLIGIGVLLAVLFAMKRRKKYGISLENIFDFILIGLPCAIVGARFVYVIGDPSCWENGIIGLIAIWDGGLSIYGGLIFAILGCLIYIKKKKLNPLRCLDFAAPSFMIGQMIGRWGNFVNGEVYGRETTLPWGMEIVGETDIVHPLFLYECLWMLIGFVVLAKYSERRKRNGEVFSLYLIWYGIGRMWMESLRDETFVLRIIGMPLSFMISVLILALGAFMIWYIYKKKPAYAVAKTILSPDEFKEENGVAVFIKED